MNINQIIQHIENITSAAHPHEYSCHIQYVVKIAKQLIVRYGGNPKIIIAASLLHDIGRDNAKNVPHELFGAEAARDILSPLSFTSPEIEHVANCIMSHSTKIVKPKTKEAKIVATADGASKILYAHCFVLLSKKEPREKKDWAVKHIKKGYKQIQFRDYKKEIRQAYRQAIYMFSQ